MIDRDAAGLAAVADAITAAGGHAMDTTLDLPDSDAIRLVICAVADQLGGIDIIVNASGNADFNALDADGYDEL